MAEHNADVPVGMVSCASTTGPASALEGPSLGFTQDNIASPLCKAWLAVQVVKFRFIADIASGLDPSVMPIVSHESASEAPNEAKNTGETPPTSTPVGLGV